MALRRHIGFDEVARPETCAWTPFYQCIFPKVQFNRLSVRILHDGLVFLMQYYFTLYTEERGAPFSLSSIEPKETVGTTGMVQLISNNTVVAMIRGYIE